MLEEHTNFYESIMKILSPLSIVFSDIEKFYTESYDVNRWKEFYSEEEYMKEFANEENNKKCFYTKILNGHNQDNKQFFYSGFINKGNQKNGKGVMITQEAKYEGNWLNDKLHGWSMITKSEGFIYEGK